ncbi:MAG: hypothetical protein H8D95_01420 [Candidatus Endolissoclinum sp.]|jgi:hypothetical protein|nr:hypothetical protein [Candidatus Endolissoclinum sp.]|tara:strand:+ start:5214 stop:5837 length:624 start_codon:yes stop_codon:yes gene_type:complete
MIELQNETSEERREVTLDYDIELNNTYLSIADIKKTFLPNKWTHLDEIVLCGNVDEPVINPDVIEIIKYFYHLDNKEKDIWVHVNGGSRNESFWSELGKLSKELNNRLTVIFGIDGDEETNHLYRKNVDWKTLQKNWRAYISAGGRAAWQFIVFKWNQHQINDIKKLSESEGFARFGIIESFRNKDADNEIDEIVLPEGYETLDRTR